MEAVRGAQERQCAARAAAPQTRLPTTRGAMNYSIRNLVIAGGLAIAAIAAVLIYTSNVQQAAKQGQARVSVLVAQVDIPAGTPAKDILTAGHLIPQKVVQDDVLPGALTTTDGLDGKVLKQDLYT